MEAEATNSVKNTISLKINGYYYQRRRHCSCVIAYQNKWIWVIYGNQDYKDIDDIEKINIAQSNEWMIVKPRANDCSKRCDMMGIQIYADKMIIFGNYESDENTETYIIEIDEDSCVINKHSELEAGAKFNSTVSPLIVGNKVYAMDYDKRVHIYNRVTEKWSMLKVR